MCIQNAAGLNHIPRRLCFAVQPDMALRTILCFVSAQRFRLTATHRRHRPSESRHQLPVDLERLAALIPPL